MRKIFIIIVMVALVGISVWGYKKSNEYQMVGKITNVYNEHWCMVETKDGHVWEFDGYGFKEGQQVIVTFNSMDTKLKTDDVIVNVAEAH